MDDAGPSSTFVIAETARWDTLDAGKYRDEAKACAALLREADVAGLDRVATVQDAADLVRAARRGARRQGVVESFLQEFGLGTAEGLALMCLAEALLRTPDDATRDALIAEKIGSADWSSHLGRSDSAFVNASTFGLMLTGRLVDVEDDARRDVAGYVRRLATRLGEPVIRAAVGRAIRIMGEQFVLGRTIDEALRRARREGWVCSFDMLGEGARTDADAARYEAAYAAAIEAVGAHQNGVGPEVGHGVSVKLSALSPRYDALQEARVQRELYPRLQRLAVLAARYDLNLCIDAEEADRLTLSMKLLDRLALDPALGAWRGLGVAVQAYQKRAPEVIARLADLARRSGRRLMVRLVKGAYWDTEIKKAQIAGRPDYPVFTTKVASDVSFLVCARALIDAAPSLYGQFATHNAHTLSAVRRMAQAAGVTVESQRLHGMGEALYAAARDRYGEFPLRAYAPVGGHKDLLPYLVRRLLENGANTSFVHALLDDAVPPEAVVADPIAALAAHPDRHARIPAPAALYGPSRRNSAGADLADVVVRERLARALAALDGERLVAAPIVSGRTPTGAGAEVLSPADRTRVVGRVIDAEIADVDAAFAQAVAAQPAWNALGGAGRAPVLRSAADAFEAAADRFGALLVREAGKTWSDAIGEVREAVDFLRYYAASAERLFGAAEVLVGPVGEVNTLHLHGRGVFACISPWNFPLAIFTGQIAAALAAGNAVVAKPAEQTPLIAAEMVRLIHAAGVDPRLLALTPGPGETIGAALIADPRLAGVAFTGGTETAWAINRALGARRGPILPLIAETGGLNAMFVDTTALREQVIDDVVVSAFGSAGQRCSALRLLLLPEETADLVLEGLVGALEALVVGDPADFAVDVGPVIDLASRDVLDAHLRQIAPRSRIVARATTPPVDARSSFFAPMLVEIESVEALETEVFGPVLHVVRYAAGGFEAVAKALASKGYGLTLGVHSRIDGFAAAVQARVPAGNVYVNRSLIGAIVGVQPFGGEGLSGTGPKAGGPYTLLRFAVERAVSVNIAAQGGDPALLNLG